MPSRTPLQADLAAAAHLVWPRLAVIRGDRRGMPPQAEFRPASKRLLQHIATNIGDPLSLSDLAVVAGVGPLQSFACLPSRYRLFHRRSISARARSKRPRPMIRETIHPIAEIAYACGFSSQSHLTTTCRNVTGVTPAAYRRQMLPEPGKSVMRDVAASLRWAANAARPSV